MKIPYTKLKKISLIVFCVGAGIFLLLLLFISPLTKYLVEKYDERFLGRQITMDWAYVNPFTGYVYFSNFKAYESERDTLFFTANGVSADFAMWKLFSKTYEISQLTITKPRGTIIQNKKTLNFDDLIKRFRPDTLDLGRKPTHFNILNLVIEHGEFYYREKVIPINYVIKDLNLQSSGKRWDSDTIATSFSFLSQNGKGGMKGDLTINVKNKDYRLSTRIRNFDLEIIRQYLWELINYGMFSAQLDANIRATGNFKNPDSINVKGRLSFKDFHLGKTVKDDYAAFDNLVIVIDEFSPMNQKFLFDSVTLKRPFFRYEKFDSLNNMEMLFGKNGANISDVTAQAGRFNLIIEIGRYLKKLTRNFFQSQYRVNRLRVAEGDIKFSDFSLSEQFTIDAKEFSIQADSLSKLNKRMNVYVKSSLKPYGDASVALGINPKDSGDFDMTYHLNKIPVSIFNPYLISFTSFPLDRGTLELDGVWNVRNGDIKSVNHLLLLDLRLSKRVRNKDVRWIPMPLIMTFVRERGNFIDYEIPIQGNLKNPHFRLGDVIEDLLKNIFVKPVTIPYGIKVKTVENKIENALTLKWDMRQRQLRPKQRRFVEDMALFLEKNTEASITVYPNQFGLKEKEHILFFEAKKKYFLLSHHKSPQDFTEADSIDVDKMSVKDPAFVHVIKTGISDTVMFTIQDKCYHFVGHAKVDAQSEILAKEREKEFQSFFIRNGTQQRVKMNPGIDSVPYNGFSYFKISYQGDIPKSLRKAYEDMHDLNEEILRKKYFEGEGVGVKTLDPAVH